MRFVMVAGLVAVAAWAGGADDKKGDKAKFDPAAVVGKWEIVSGIKNGEAADPKNLAKAKFEIGKDTMTLTSPDGAFKFKYKIDTTATPAKIDMEITESPFGAGMKAPGVVKMDKGGLTLAYDPMGEKRPDGFDGKKGFVFVMKKVEDKK